METHSQDKLTELIHRELMKLPERAAPETLAPRVLAAIEKRERCWWRQPWSHWPFWMRVVSVPAMLGCVGLFVFALTLIARLQLLEWAAGQAAQMAGPLAPAWDVGVTVASALWNAVQLLNQPVVWAAAATIAFLMYLTCLAVGTACLRVVCSPARSK